MGLYSPPATRPRSVSARAREDGSQVTDSVRPMILYGVAESKRKLDRITSPRPEAAILLGSGGVFLARKILSLALRLVCGSFPFMCSYSDSFHLFISVTVGVSLYAIQIWSAFCVLFSSSVPSALELLPVKEKCLSVLTGPQVAFLSFSVFQT